MSLGAPGPLSSRRSGAGRRGPESDNPRCRADRNRGDHGVAARFCSKLHAKPSSHTAYYHILIRGSRHPHNTQRVGGGLTRSGAPCPRALPDYGEAGIHREGHRESSKAKPRRDAASVPRSCERPICRCRGQIGPEGDGWLRGATRSRKVRGHLGLNRRGWSRYAFCSGSTKEHL